MNLLSIKDKLYTILPDIEWRDIPTMIGDIFTGKFFQNKKRTKMLAYPLFITFLLLIYIFNNNYSNKLARQTHQLEKDIQEIHSELVANTSELMLQGRMSKVAKSLEATGIKLNTTPPTKIIVYE